MLKNVDQGLNFKNIYEGLNIKNVFEGLNARSAVYLSKCPRLACLLSFASLFSWAQSIFSIGREWIVFFGFSSMILKLFIGLSSIILKLFRAELIIYQKTKMIFSHKNRNSLIYRLKCPKAKWVGYGYGMEISMSTGLWC